MTGLGTHPSMTSAAIESGWASLEAELDIWQSAGRIASFWWRDDDAVAATPALDRLLVLARDVPIALAVIPGCCAGDELAGRLGSFANATVLQHGWRHTNYAPAGERKSELGTHRPLSERLDELRRGRERLASLFGSRALGVLVPPWNRIASDLVPRLPEIGIGGLSTDGARPAAAVAGVRRVNVHVDLVDWHGGRGFVGEVTALGLVLRHLRGRFLGSVDPEEPTGILTHHLVQDAAAARFLRQLLAILGRHPAARFVPIAELFA